MMYKSGSNEEKPVIGLLVKEALVRREPCMIKKWKTVLCIFLAAAFLPAWLETPLVIKAEQSEIAPSDLYAQSAVLMDADSGRILFEKSGQRERPMASTTKIMTCILALEKGVLSDTVSVSKEAAAQPQVKLGMREGETYSLNDLLYSLMLESHNDTATAIAEHIGGSVEGFADMMNQKAEELKCSHTYFITPNGLDARDEKGNHHTTAEDLARIMKYCIMDSPQKDEFLKITRTPEYSFTDSSGSRSFQCVNHNAFLKMMDGALSGKTGFTGDAGYCYVGALRQDDRTFIVALLACGWPNAKSYKWSDTRKLMNYGLENFFYQTADIEQDGRKISVENAFSGGFPDLEPKAVSLCVSARPPSVLVKEGEKIEVHWQLPQSVKAPVQKGEKLGTVSCSLDGEILLECPVTAGQDVEQRTLTVCARWIRDRFLFGT